MNTQVSHIVLADKEQVTARLTAAGVYPTSQRVAIAQVLLAEHQHVTADKLQEMLYLSGSKISKATVYNSLKRFVEKGLVSELVIDNQRAFYDTNTSHHHHVYNLDTGELSDIDSFNLSLLQSVELPQGTEIDSVDLVLRVRNT
ncbi:Fur family transcriptional regulator [Neptunomonas concharum]|uniref:Ferric uptake regulation protein n=1 Tax=Neptunomonas concharum TaxID=1031538 RepID=A0A5P1RBP5_9GAMM|nr:transcriptional repressor [Neptunomonas concharum]QEQ97023.1 transcriptional repressor [Neptunomonas concharum]